MTYVGKSFSFTESSCASTNHAIEEADRCAQWLLSPNRLLDVVLFITLGPATENPRLRFGFNSANRVGPKHGVAFLQAMSSHPSIRAAQTPIPLSVHFASSDNEALFAALQAFNDGFFDITLPLRVILVGVDCGSSEKILSSLTTFLRLPRCRVRNLHLNNVAGGERGFQTLEECITSARSVAELHLAHTNPGEGFADTVGRAISKTTHIQSLKVTIVGPHLGLLVKWLTSNEEHGLRYLSAELHAWNNQDSLAAGVVALIRSNFLLSFSFKCSAPEAFYTALEERTLKALESNPTSPLLSLSLPWSPSRAAVRRLVNVLTSGSNLRRIRFQKGSLDIDSSAALLAVSSQCKLDVLETWTTKESEISSAEANALASALRHSTMTSLSLLDDHNLPAAVESAATANLWLCRDSTAFARYQLVQQRFSPHPVRVCLAAEKLAVAKTLLRCARTLLFAIPASEPNARDSTTDADPAASQLSHFHRRLPRLLAESVLEALMGGWFLPRDITEVIAALGDRRSIGRLLRPGDWYGQMEEREFVWRCAAFRLTLR
ncbi:hypothetical protein DFJ73DRAFT_831032 [Zopfochytrium polystomum]|nr:hypothetical protein DFJ73DRAFT_831032 [Zopfochytrium polystomum]